jgi:hypothetical protein
MATSSVGVNGDIAIGKESGKREKVLEAGLKRVTDSCDGCFLSMTSTDPIRYGYMTDTEVRVSVPENTAKILYGKCTCTVCVEYCVGCRWWRWRRRVKNEMATLAAVLLGVSVRLGGAQVSSRRGSLESTPQQNRQNMLKSLQTGRCGAVELQRAVWRCVSQRQLEERSRERYCTGFSYGCRLRRSLSIVKCSKT